MTPVEPAPTRWDLSVDGAVPGEDLVGVGADLEPGTVLAAYRLGLFPMGLGDGGAPPVGWWSPDPRGVLLPGGLRVTRSLRRSARRYRCTVDTAFADVVRACADPARSGRWITPEVEEAYGRLHELGWAHSVEVWDDGDGDGDGGAGGDGGPVLVGGLYGLALGGLFCGESMFHHATDASKVALAHLVEVLSRDGVPRVVEVQWATPHLASLGVVEIGRDEYLDLLPELLARPLPDEWR